MALVVPQARLVYVVRDPIARMQSMYMHQVSAGRERRRAEVALPAPLRASPRPPGTQSMELVNFTVRRWQRMIHRRPGTKT
jgi:hypothetical protein